jgi:hypothetical protein
MMDVYRISLVNEIASFPRPSSRPPRKAEHQASIAVFDMAVIPLRLKGNLKGRRFAD